MLAGVCLGTNDINKAAVFYDAVLSTLNIERLHTTDVELAYGIKGQEANIWIISPYNEKPATFGNGMQVSFSAASKESIHAFHAAALANGGSDEGAPGPRDYTPTYYGAYCRDQDGNKLHVFLE